MASRRPQNRRRVSRSKKRATTRVVEDSRSGDRRSQQR